MRIAKPNDLSHSPEGPTRCSKVPHPAKEKSGPPNWGHECTSQSSLFVQMMVPLGLALVFALSALSVSNRFQIIALLILNKALGRVLSFMKFRLTLSSRFERRKHSDGLARRSGD
jgi:hypothetical protein